MAQADGVLATRLWGAAAALRESIGAPLRSNAQQYDHHVAQVRAGLGEDAFAVAWEEGLIMSWEQAVAYALSRS